jgi:hypothetical protein
MVANLAAVPGCGCVECVSSGDLVLEPRIVCEHRYEVKNADGSRFCWVCGDPLPPKVESPAS